MPRVDRFVLGVSALVLLLIVLAVGSVALAQRREPPRIADTSPTGVVYNYLAALNRDEYDTAYSYLSSQTRAWISREEFRRRAPSPAAGPAAGSTSVSLGNERISGDTARVTITITTFYPSGPFGGNEYTRTHEVTLVREAGVWKIDAPRDAAYLLYPSRF